MGKFFSFRLGRPRETLKTVGAWSEVLAIFALPIVVKVAKLSVDSAGMSHGTAEPTWRLGQNRGMMSRTS